MNVLKKLNSMDEEKPYHGFGKLKEGYHEVLSFRSCTNKYGKNVICELSDQIIFLPRYLSDQIDEKDLKDLNSFTRKLYLYFGGRNEEKK